MTMFKKEAPDHPVLLRGDVHRVAPARSRRLSLFPPTL